MQPRGGDRTALAQLPGAPQDQWIMLLERPAGQAEIRTAPLEKPILYRRD